MQLIPLIKRVLSLQLSLEMRINVVLELVSERDQSFILLSELLDAFPIEAVRVNEGDVL
jgi:SAM-dependent MidA family methyltransferase